MQRLLQLRDPQLATHFPMLIDLEITGSGGETSTQREVFSVCSHIRIRRFVSSSISLLSDSYVIGVDLLNES